MKYYAMVREEHLDRASGLTGELEANRVAQMVAQSVQVTGDQSDSLANGQGAGIVEITKENTDSEGFRRSLETTLVGEEGLEPPTSTL